MLRACSKASRTLALSGRSYWALSLVSHPDVVPPGHHSRESRRVTQQRLHQRRLSGPVLSNDGGAGLPLQRKVGNGEKLHLAGAIGEPDRRPLVLITTRPVLSAAAAFRATSCCRLGASIRSKRASLVALPLASRALWPARYLLMNASSRSMYSC